MRTRSATIARTMASQRWRGADGRRRTRFTVGDESGRQTWGPQDQRLPQCTEGPPLVILLGALTLAILGLPDADAARTAGRRRGRVRRRAVLPSVLLALVGGVAGCGSAGATATTPAASRSVHPTGIPASLLAGERQIGRGPRFYPGVNGPVTGRCRPHLGRRVAAHVELFADNHVVLIAAGVGTRPRREVVAGRIVRAGCFGAVVTLDPTGAVLIRPGRPPRLSALFRAWGEPLSTTRIASFSAAPGQRVAVFVNGRRRRTDPESVPLSAGAEIVLEVGPYVPPHRRYMFPPPPAPSMP
jgi:hypothetical protein